MIESKIDELIAALDRNTAARVAGAPAAAAAPAKAPTPAAPAAPKPAAAPAAPKAAPKAAPAAAAPTDERYTTAREKMKQLLDDPAKGPNEVRDVLSRIGATKLSDVKVEQLDDLLSKLDASIAGNSAGDSTTGGMFD